jgi:hypothetical protein
MTPDEPKLKSIVELTSQPPIMEFEGFILRPLDGWHLFLEHPSGEGTQIGRIEFLAWLDRLFKEKF